MNRAILRSITRTSEVVIVSRYYFHLVDDYDIIPDEIGIEVSDLKEVYVEATKAIGEFRQEHTADAAAWEDWRVEVTDAWGDTILTLPLSGIEFCGMALMGRELTLSRH
jgi:hypothetical protein